MAAAMVAFEADELDLLDEDALESTLNLDDDDGDAGGGARRRRLKASPPAAQRAAFLRAVAHRPPSRRKPIACPCLARARVMTRAFRCVTQRGKDAAVAPLRQRQRQLKQPLQRPKPNKFVPRSMSHFQNSFFPTYSTY